MGGEEVVGNPQNPPLPKGFTPLKQHGVNPPLPKGFTPIEKNDSPFPTHGYQPTAQDLKDRQHLNDLESSFDKLPNTTPHPLNLDLSKQALDRKQYIQDLQVNPNAEHYQQLAQQRTDYEKENPGSWSNTMPILTHAITRMVTKPLVGAARITRDLIGATDNKTVAAKPLYGANGGLTDYGKQVDSGKQSDVLGKLVTGLDAYNNQTEKEDYHAPLPHNLAGNTATGIIGIAPDIISTFALPEERVGAGLLERMAFNPFNKVLATKGGLNAYSEAEQKGATPATATIEGLKGAGKSELEATGMNIIGGVSSKFVESVLIKGLEKTGIVANNILTKKGAAAVSNAAIFSLYPIAKSLAQGKPIDWDEVEQSGGTGFVFGAAGGHRNEETPDLRVTSETRQAIAVQNFMNASPEAIKSAHDIETPAADINADAIAHAAKFDETKDPQYAATASTLTKTADVKATTDAILKDKDGFISSIEQSHLPDETKQAVIAKVEDTHKVLDPTENAKNALGNQISDIDTQLSAIPKEETDPVKSAENEVKTETLTKQREDLNNQLKQTILKQQENESTNQKNGEESSSQSGSEKSSTESNAVATEEKVSKSGEVKAEPDNTTIKDNSIEKVYSENKNISDLGSKDEYRRHVESIFPDSKVKDVFYHGSKNKDIEQFDKKYLGTGEGYRGFGDGFYFGHDRDLIDKEYGKGGKTYPVILDIKKNLGWLSKADDGLVAKIKNKYPDLDINKSDTNGDIYEKLTQHLYNYKYDTDEFSTNKFGYKPTEKTNEVFKSLGYDSITNENSLDNKGQLIVFDPEQVHILGSEKDVNKFKESKAGELDTTEKEPTKTSDKAKILADRIRSLKSDRNKLHGGLEGVATAVYDGALETVATTIEAGGKLADAIQAGIEHIKAKYPELDEKDVRKKLEDDLEGMGDEDAKDTPPEQEATYGTKNAITEDLQKGLGLPPIEIPKDRTDDESLASWKSGKRTPQDIIDGLLDTNTGIYDKSITPNDEPIMREYIRQLGERGKELNKIKAHLEEKGDESDIASVSQQIDRHLDEYNDALNASKVGGNIWHKYGDERQKAIDDKGLIQNGIDRIHNIYGSEIPADITKKLKDLQARFDNLEAKNALLEKRITENEASKNFGRITKSPRVKKTDADFHKERIDIIEQMRRDFKKSFGQLNATVPGIPQLNAIAPHVGRLLRSYAEQGIVKLEDAVDKVHGVVKDIVDGITKDDIRDIIAGKYSEKKTLSELNKDVNSIRQQARLINKIRDLEKGIAAKTAKRTTSSPEIEALQKRVAELKKESLNAFAHLSAEDLQKQASAIQRQIDKGDFFKQPTAKRTWEKDPEWVKNNKEKSDLTFKLRKMEREAMDSKKSRLMRSLDWTNRWGRRVIFFGANAVYTKLASAAVLGSFAHRIPEQGVGKLNAKLFPHIAKNAPIEGAMNAQAEGKFYSEFTNPIKFAKNTYDIAKTGETELSRELGKQLPHHHIPILDLFAADTHIMIKDPVKRATFEASLVNYLKWYENNGVDGTHPMMLESARQAAYKRAEYEIFQDSDPNGNKVKRFFSELEKTAIINRNLPDGYSKVKGNAQYTAASLYHFFVPINTVPVNILKRVGLGLALPFKYYEAATKNRDVRNGILKMTGEESDAVMRQLKKGNISAAYWTLGFVLAGSAAGGLYTPFYSNKDRQKSVDTQDADYLNLHGVDVPKDVQHNTQFQALQMGASWRIVYDHYVDDNGESQLMADFAATMATAGVAAKQHPVIETASNVLEATKTPHGNTKFVRDLKRRVGAVKAGNVLKAMGYDISMDDQ